MVEQYEEEEAIHARKHELASGPDGKQGAGGEQTQRPRGVDFKWRCQDGAGFCQQSLLASKMTGRQVGRSCGHGCPLKHLPLQTCDLNVTSV